MQELLENEKEELKKEQQSSQSNKEDPGTDKTNTSHLQGVLNADGSTKQDTWMGQRIKDQPLTYGDDSRTKMNKQQKKPATTRATFSCAEVTRIDALETMRTISEEAIEDTIRMPTSTELPID